jgi:hypothetical protein
MRANTDRSDREIDRQQGRAHRTSTARRRVRGAAVCERLSWHGDFGDSPGVEKNLHCSWPTARLGKLFSKVPKRSLFNRFDDTIWQRH